MWLKQATAQGTESQGPRWPSRPPGCAIFPGGVTTPEYGMYVNPFLCELTLPGLAECLKASSPRSLWLWNKLQPTQPLDTRRVYDLGIQGSGVQALRDRELWSGSPKAATQVSAGL